MAVWLDGSGLEGSSSSSEMVKLSEHPRFRKYFKMLAEGTDKDAVKSIMRGDGCDLT
jgi:hypothetical protein